MKLLVLRDRSKNNSVLRKHIYLQDEEEPIFDAVVCFVYTSYCPAVKNRYDLRFTTSLGGKMDRLLRIYPNVETLSHPADTLTESGLKPCLVSKSNPEYKVDHYIITPLAVRFMEFNDVVTKERSKINKKSRDQARKYIEQDELEE